MLGRVSNRLHRQPSFFRANAPRGLLVEKLRGIVVHAFQVSRKIFKN